jgi:LmbE family N-acetylglucosaminyl deacetylase
MKKKILVIVAHPDDEMLGCGGTLLKLKKENCEIKSIFLSDGESSRSKKKNYKKEIKTRENQAIKISKNAGFIKPKFFRLRDNSLDKYPLLKVIKKIEKEMSRFNPNIIFTHSDVDLNIDHQIVNRAVVTACRPHIKNNLEGILTFETPSSTETNFNDKKKLFHPNYFVNISKFVKKKLELLKIYRSEIMKWPHPRSLKNIKALSMYRGSQSGFNYAEAFIILRLIQK